MIQHRPEFRKSGKSALRSGRYKMPNFSSTDQKEFKLCHSLDIDNMTSPSKFGEITWPILHFMGLFILQTSFLGILKIVIFQDLFRRWICTILQNFKKFQKLHFQKSWFSAFWSVNYRPRQIYQKILRFCASYGYQHVVKIS